MGQQDTDEGCQGKAERVQALLQVHTFKSELPMLSVCFAPDGRSIAAAGDEGSVHLFDTSTTVSTAVLPTGQTQGTYCSKCQSHKLPA